MENGTSSAVCIPFTQKQTDQLKMRTEAAVLQREDQIRNETKTQHLTDEPEPAMDLQE
jgi:hypothetical protein